MLSYLQACMKPREDVGLMGCACEYRQPTVPNWDDRLLWLVWCVTTARTIHSAGRAVIEKFSATFGRKPAERTELFEVVVTPDERNR